MLKWTKQQQQQQNLQIFQTLSQSQPNSQNSYPTNSLNSHSKSRKKRYTIGNSNLAPNHNKMPTMTHTLERRLHRRSLDNHLDAALDERRRSRHSLTGNHNKENFGVHFMRNSFGNTSLTALHDLSNGKSPRRSMEQTPPIALNIKRFNTATVTNNEMTPNVQVNEMRSRFSDDFAAEDDVTPLSRLKFRNKLKEDSLSSSRMGDVTLDRMLDAIIESARKEVKPKCKHVIVKKEENKEEQREDPEESIHEMEVRTPQHLKRQRVVRRKNPKNTEKKNKKEKQAEMARTLDKSFEEKSTRKEKKEQEMIGLTLPNGIPSPETPIFKNSQTQKALLNMETPPQHLTFQVENNLQRCSTPTLEEAQSIKRCLSFSEEEEEYQQSHKRSSVASSIASSTQEQIPCTSSNSVKGSLDVAIYKEQENLNVHVIRCRDLQRSNGSSNLNAYVKVALIRKNQTEHQGFQRTAVHRHSSRPYFDHCFKFDLSDLNQALENIDEDDRLQMAVWHRDRQHKRSEFLGCISFPLSTLLQQQEINGSYKLQTQQCLNKPQPLITVQQQLQQHQQQQPPPQQQQPHQTLTIPSLSSLAAVATGNPENIKFSTNSLSNINTIMATTMTQIRNTDDAVSIDSMATGQMAGEQQPMILSKKALHQRDADENLFLRFLELDPPTTDPPPSQGTPVAGRRLSNTKPMGRTPFTMTKKLTRTAERGFGFSIVWTHPPRVEKVEPGLSADRCGIYPGDYVIFVDKHNVVTMPEADVLNLIRSQGATLTLEIFRRSGSGTNAGAAGSSINTATSLTHRSLATTLPMNGKTSRMAASGTSINNPVDEIMSVTVGGGGGSGGGGIGMVTKQHMLAQQNRPSTACSVNTNSSLEAAKRRLNLPQVTFSKESIAPITDNRRRFLLQLISREQNFMSAIHFGMQRFVQPLQERKDLITPNDHRTLFQNIDELLRISEDVLEQLCHDDQEPQMNFASRVYLSKTTAICAAYKKYCNGIKRADCVLVNKSRQTGSEFVSFITEPPVPRKRPDLTMFIHRPLQHFREILKLMQLLASNCHVDTEEHKNFTSVINELQAAYREITVTSGLMEPLGEGRPLLTLQDLESRMVFTKCKPFTLAVQGRQWIFGGDLSRVEGRSVKPYWTLLFSDIIVFAKVSRDRVLFITEEPIPIANIVDSCFHMRKKTTEFRLTVDPNGRLAESPTGYCAPDLTKTPKKGARRKSLVLRAPSLELKAVWQNLLQRQIFLVNAALGSTPLSSPLDSPDVLNTLVPLSDIGIASASIGSIKLSSMDSINMKNQQQQQHHQQQNNRLSSNVSEKIEKLIDEKCRILNKTGTSKSSALHLANWMKGQLDKQQEQARLVVAQSMAGKNSPPHNDMDEDVDSANFYEINDQDERITYWTRQQLEKRTKELNLSKEDGQFSVKPNFGGKRLSGVEEMSMSDSSYSEGVSQISQPHSTTSDSQITVRSSPNVLDKLAVCRHCHKNCQQQQQQQQQQNVSPTLQHPEHPTKTHQVKPGEELAKCPLSPSSQMRTASGLICHSLKVQHSQSSPQRCCNVNGGTGGSSNSRASSVTSISSGTVTGDKPSDNQAAFSNSKYEVGDTESDVAQLLTDEVYQSETTDEGNASNNTPKTNTTSTTTTSSSSITSCGGVEEARRRITDSIHKLRILDEHNEAAILMNGHCTTTTTTSSINTTATSTLTSSETESDEREQFKPEPPPRKFSVIQPQQAKATEEENKAKEMVKMSVTITETAKIVIVEDTKITTQTTPTKSPRTPKSPKSPKSPLTPKSVKSTTSSTKTNQFVPCTCKCLPEDFANTTLSPEEVELQMCKMLESPKQSPKMPRSQEDEENTKHSSEDPHKYCKCTCDKTLQENLNTKQEKEDDDLSLMLIGLAQLTPAAKLLNMKTPTAPLPTPTQNFASYNENGFVPTIAIVPATPDSVLTKTSTNVWDNSTHVTTSTATANLLISHGPRQAVIENIPEDSCDESPLDEEPPYRPMSSTLRRFGTMSSLERLPSEDRLEDNLDEYEDELDDDDDEEVDDEDEELMDKARADNIELDNEIRVVTKAIYENAEQAGSSNNLNGSAWTSRASTFVSGKMSFFEESRAFIDKYLGRWNQDQANVGNNGITSDPEEQMDECTSGATSGEEVWGTPTSGGDNDDMHMANSENTQSSPTKSSNSLNDDDDTELMMDELLMAPPMSASTIRGLLPRRRLEPLFEEETESDEEKTQQESEELKKGETTTNGHYLEDSEAGSSSEEEEEEGEEEEDLVNTADYDEEDEDLTSTEERLQPNLQTTNLGPRPLSHPILPAAVLKASSCEYLLDQPVNPTAGNTMVVTNSLATTMPVTATNLHSSSKTMVVISASTTLTMTAMANTTTTTTTTVMTTKVPITTTTCSMMDSTIVQTIPNPVPLPASIIISKEKDTIKKDKDVCSKEEEKKMGKTLPRPAKFIPPPPPPRRLLLTQTNLKTSGPIQKNIKQPPLPPKSGVFADDGFSVGVKDGKDVCDAPTVNTSAPPCTAMTTTTMMMMTTTTMTSSMAMSRTTMAPQKPTRIPQPIEDVYNIKKYSAVIGCKTETVSPSTKPRPSSTIIETSLLGSGEVDNKTNLLYKSSTIVSTTKEKLTTTKSKDYKIEEKEQKEQEKERKKEQQQQDHQHQVPRKEADIDKDSKSACAQPGGVGSGLSPRLEMRLALNHDILGDEDLISYDPGPDLTTILGHDLSTFQRRTGRDLLNRSATNRVQPKEAVISFSQQRNSKMDTPTVNRRPRPQLNSANNNPLNTNTNNNSCNNTSPASSMPFVGSARVGGVPQHLQPNRNTWSNSVSVDRNRDVNVSDVSNSKNINYNSGDNKLSDLEILARREKIYCMSQLRSGSQVKMGTKMMTMAGTGLGKSNNFYHNNNPLTRTTSTTSMGGVTEEIATLRSPRMAQRQRKIGRDETALMETGKANKLINFIKRRNSENPSTANNSQTSLNDSNASSTPQHKQIPMSPRKDNDKPSLNRRLWKQITKRRRSNSVSELVAS